MWCPYNDRSANQFVQLEDAGSIVTVMDGNCPHSRVPRVGLAVTEPIRGKECQIDACALHQALEPDAILHDVDGPQIAHARSVIADKAEQQAIVCDRFRPWDIIAVGWRSNVREDGGYVACGYGLPLMESCSLHPDPDDARGSVCVGLVQVAL